MPVLLCHSIHLLQDEEGDCIAHFVELPNVSASGSTKRSFS